MLRRGRIRQMGEAKRRGALGPHHRALRDCSQLLLLLPDLRRGRRRWDARALHQGDLRQGRAALREQGGPSRASSHRGGGHCWTAVAIPNPNRSHADDFSGGVLVGWQVAKKSWDQSYTNSIAPDIKNPHALPMYKAESEKRMPRMKDR